MKGRIVAVDFNVCRSVYLMQGIKKHSQKKYDGYYPGGNGTYVTGGDYDSSIDVKVFLYDLGRCITFDVKDYVLELNKRKRVSEQMVNKLQKNNVGKKIDVDIDGYSCNIPYHELNLMV
ncbi:MAG: hypothetical protein IJX63_15695 [Lachnospiraceae bacterium]|nr:hypothetical protein [Lachnospiraceae bacterium]